MKAEAYLQKLAKACGLLALLFLGSQALALEFKPLGYFEAVGRLSLGSGVVSVSCDIKIVGEAVADGKIRVDSAQFSGSNPACHRLKADNLPWPGGLISVDQLQLSGVTVIIKSLLFGGVCGPSRIQAAVDAEAATLSFPKTPLPPDCRLQGMVKVTPALQVLP